MMIIRPMEHRDGCSMVIMVMIMAALYTIAHYRTISSPMQEGQKPYWRQKDAPVRMYVGYPHSGAVQRELKYPARVVVQHHPSG
jgi:hypothetical protein